MYVSDSCTISCDAIMKRIVIANPFRVCQIFAALLMKLLPPQFLNCITEFPLWPGMKLITQPQPSKINDLIPVCEAKCFHCLVDLFHLYCLWHH